MPNNNEINKVKYPGTPTVPEFDTIANWPATTTVTQSTGEDINRNRDALLMLERVLGPNPHIGIFTKDVNKATVAERLNILENGVANGTFSFKTLNVLNAITVAPDSNRLLHLTLGAPKSQSLYATQVDVRGPTRFYDSGITDPRVLFDVGFRVATSQEAKKSTNAEIVGTSAKGKPLLTIQDFFATEIADPNHIALKVIGNVEIDGFLTANFAIDHDKLNNINTTPTLDGQGKVITTATHVSRGNYHSHRRGAYDESLGRWKVDPNPNDDTYGIIQHSDLEPVTTRTKNEDENFVPDPDVAYHVTNGDDHDHVGGDGATLKHRFLIGIDPKISNHVTGGDAHSHDPEKEDGAPIQTKSILLDDGANASLQRLEVANLANATVIITQIDSLLKSDGDAVEDHETRIATLEETTQTQEVEINSIATDARSAIASADDARSRIVDAQTTATSAYNLATTASTNATAALAAATWNTIEVVGSTTLTRSKAKTNVVVGTRAAGINLTLFAPQENDEVLVKDQGNLAATYNITITRDGSHLIDGSTTTAITTNRGYVRLQFINGEWLIVS